ncbi:unnamed protein product, partial [Arabidopsis halleri]
LWSSGKETGLRRQHVSSSIHLLRETPTHCFWTPTWIWVLAFGPFEYPERGSIHGMHLLQGLV